MREDDEKNFALEYMRNSILGEYLDRPGLTEIVINRPGELHTKINGVWEMHSSP